MTVIAMMMGSVLGLFGAILGWGVFDTGLLSAFGIYLGTSFGFAALAVMSELSRQEHCAAQSPGIGSAARG